jgi:chromosome segregation ATPase
VYREEVQVMQETCRIIKTPVAPGIVEELQEKNDSLKDKVKYLEGFIGNHSIEAIKELEKRASKVDILEAQIKEKNDTISKLEASFGKYKAEVDSNCQIWKIQQLDINKQERKKEQDNFKINTRNRVVKPLEDKLEAKDREIDRLGLVIDTLNEVNANLKESNKETQAKLDRILENQQRNTSEILDLLRAGNIKEAEDRLESVAAPVDKKAIVEEVFNLKSQGLNNSEIAKRLQEDGLFDRDLKRGPAKVGDILAGRTYGPVAKELGYIKE